RDRDLANELDLLILVVRETVDRDDGVQAELADDPEVADEIRRAALDDVDAAVGIAAVVLQRLHRRDEHGRARAQLPDTADDVEELLHSHVRAEAALGDDDVAELERDALGDEGVG